MPIWQIALILLAAVWLLQAVGTWFQVRHFRAVMGAVTDKWSDGRVGAGNARGRIGKGVIVMVVVDPQAIIRRVLMMEGRSVLAKFVAVPDWDGMTLAELRAAVARGAMDKGRATALSRAIEQLDKVADSAPASTPQLATI